MKKRLLLASCLGFVAVNTLAYMHAYKFTHFAKGGEVSKDFEEMNLWDKLALVATGFVNTKEAFDILPKSEFESVELPVRDGKKIACWHIKKEEGKGTILLFHGFTSSKASLLLEARFFEELGYSVFLVDFLGHGSSEGYQTTIGYKESEEVKIAFNYIKEQDSGQKILIFAASMGATATMRAVATYGIRPDALLLECPFGSLLQTVKNRFEIINLPKTPFPELMLFWASVQHAVWLPAHKPAIYAQSIHIPTLLMQGKADPKVKRKETQAIYKNLKGLKQLTYFKNIGHQSYCRNASTKWKKTVSNFLEIF
jgi:alpha-beta hydrolase superfamily lysophospholipase